MSPRLNRLCSELYVMILAQVADLRTLRHAVLSFKAMYFTFKKNKSRIVPKVVSNMFGQLFPEVILVERCSERIEGDDETLELVRPTLQDCEEVSKGPWTKSKVQKFSRLSSLHDHIGRLIPKFIEKAASDDDNLAASLRLRRISDAEQDRIARAMYLFQIFCLLFTQDPINSDTSAYDYEPEVRKWQRNLRIFFKNLAPWETEQLAVVHGFLGSMLPVFPIDADAVPRREYLLSQGLEAVYTLIFQDSIDFNTVTGDDDARRTHFLGPAITYIRRSGLHEESPDTLSFYADSDPGPCQAYKWGEAHRGMSVCRSWTYVMWDDERLYNLLRLQDCTTKSGLRWPTPGWTSGREDLLIPEGLPDALEITSSVCSEDIDSAASPDIQAVTNKINQ